MVRRLGYKYLQLVNGCLCRELPAESADTQWTYLNHHANDVYSGGSEPEMSQRSWIQTIIQRHGILSANNECNLLFYNCSAPNDG